MRTRRPLFWQMKEVQKENLGMWAGGIGAGLLILIVVCVHVTQGWEIVVHLAFKVFQLLLILTCVTSGICSINLYKEMREAQVGPKQDKAYTKFVCYLMIFLVSLVWSCVFVGGLVVGT